MMDDAKSSRQSSSPRLVSLEHHRPFSSRAGKEDAQGLHVTSFGCEAVSELEPRALGLTYWFDTAAQGDPYRVMIRFAGHRIGVNGAPGPRDSFNRIESIENVLPGCGPIAVTTRVVGITPGEWQVTAAPVSEPRSRSSVEHAAPARLPRVARASASGHTEYAPLVQVCAPGVHLGAWPAFVGIGALVGFATQGMLATHHHLHIFAVLLVSLAASLVGLVGAKAYYLTEQYLAGHRGAQRPAILEPGMCIQGFVIGAVATLILGALLFGLSVGHVLDVTTPGLFLAMAIGRFGCFFGGCCVGRPTTSRWGVWSSDRHLGVRRVPTQIVESALALLVALVTLAAAWGTTPKPSGVPFVGAVAIYTLGRQLLFPLRDHPRNTSYGRILTMALASLVFIVAIDVAFFVEGR